MSKYLFDTSILLYLHDPGSPLHLPVKERCLQLQDDDQIFVSVLSLYELYYAMLLTRKEGREQLAAHTLQVINEIEKHFKILPLGRKKVPIFWKLKALYEGRSRGKNGKKPLKTRDAGFILAGAAIEYGLIVVSNDDFFQNMKAVFPDLPVENWTKI